MARPIWRGAISFGLVTVPVGLYSATEDHTYHFRQFERGTSDRVRYRRVNERTGEEVAYSDIVKGYDLGGGDHVVVEPDELADIAPGRSKSIEIESFVDLDEIDPIFFQRTYWLAPTDEKYEHSYTLLCQALTRTNRAGIAGLVLRSKQYLCLVRADRDVLALETLHFADEIRDPATALPEIPKPTAAKGKELDMAVELIESMSTTWQPEEHRDTYNERVDELIESKREGRKVLAESGPPEPTDVVDLTDALRRSVPSRRSGKRQGGKRQGGSTRSGDRGRELASLNKADLERRARELGVAGRSTMNRDELVAAVSSASGDAEDTGTGRKAS